MAAPARSSAKQFRLLDLTTPTPVPRLIEPPPVVETPPPASALGALRSSLAPELARKLLSGSELITALARERRDELIPTTLAPFDALLGGGLPRGKMVELTGRRTSGRFSIVLAALAAATSMGEAAVLIDLGDHLEPAVAEGTGVDLRRLLWIRPNTLKEAVMATEMIVATGFQLVVLDAGEHPIRGRRVPDAAWVRLGRAAEAHGAAMLISTPYALTGTASEAMVAAARAKAQWLGGGRSPRVLAGTKVDVRLEKHRHRKPGAQGTITFGSEWQVASREAEPVAAPARDSRLATHP